MILRTGGYCKKAIGYYDIGLTLGLGLEYLNNSSFINFGYKLGYRESKQIELKNEIYSEIIISFVSSDKWFK